MVNDYKFNFVLLIIRINSQTLGRTRILIFLFIFFSLPSIKNKKKMGD